jgi:hypothetical protein
MQSLHTLSGHFTNHSGGSSSQFIAPLCTHKTPKLNPDRIHTSHPHIHLRLRTKKILVQSTDNATGSNPVAEQAAQTPNSPADNPPQDPVQFLGQHLFRLADAINAIVTMAESMSTME